MKEFLEKHLEPLGIIIGGVTCMSYGFTAFFPFLQAISLLLPLSILVYFFYNRKAYIDAKQAENIAILESIMEEQDSVIVEYEKVFDSQLVELPCICGGNTFVGLISPTLPNVVRCESCKNNYRVEVSYNSVLISDPLNLERTFEELVEDSVN